MRNLLLIGLICTTIPLTTIAQIAVITNDQQVVDTIKITAISSSYIFTANQNYKLNSITEILVNSLSDLSKSSIENLKKADVKISEGAEIDPNITLKYKNDKSEFIVDNGKVTFVKVYYIESTISELSNFLATTMTSDITSNGSTISGQIKDGSTNLKQYGGGSINDPILLDGKMNASVVIQHKSDRYRVIINNMRWSQDLMGYSTHISAEEAMLKRDGTFKGSWSRSLNRLRRFLEDHYRLVKNSSLSDDW